MKMISFNQDLWYNFSKQLQRHLCIPNAKLGDEFLVQEEFAPRLDEKGNWILDRRKCKYRNDPWFQNGEPPFRPWDREDYPLEWIKAEQMPPDLCRAKIQIIHCQETLCEVQFERI